MNPLKLYFHGPSPNPWKVVVILEDLQIPYELVDVDYPDMKKEPYLSVNPNGRVPALEDPNTGITVWESGSIFEYLVDKYDTEKRLTYTTSPEVYAQNNWKYFQVSGQGPYFGQKAWFTVYHPEKIPSAIDRYAKEIQRVLSVIDLHLEKTKKPYLVGEKCSYADLMWVAWNTMVPMLLGQDFLKEWQEQYPKCWEWHQRLLERESVKKTLALRQKYLQPH